jgi:hypothetical protein
MNPSQRTAIDTKLAAFGCALCVAAIVIAAITIATA